MLILSSLRPVAADPIPWDSICGGSDDRIIQAILEALRSPDSHSNPARAFDVLLKRLKTKSTLRISVDGVCEPKLDSCTDVAKYFNNEWGGPASRSWCYENRITVVEGAELRCSGKLTRWYRDRCYFNLLAEESTHFWQNGVSLEKALRLTPKYADYLRATGSGFCGETYFSALMEEHGRQLSSIELERYGGRVAYHDWLKAHGRCTKAVPGNGMPLLDTTSGIARRPGIVGRIIQNPGVKFVGKCAGVAAVAAEIYGTGCDFNRRVDENQDKECLLGVYADSTIETVLNSLVENATLGVGRFDFPTEASKNNRYDPEKGTWSTNFRGDWCPGWGEFWHGAFGWR